MAFSPHSSFRCWRLRYLSPFLLILCIILTIVLLIWVSILQHRQSAEPSTIKSTIAAPQLEPISSEWLNKHLAFNEIAEKEKPQIIFLGDSITEQWTTVGSESWERYFKKRGAINFGISGDKTQNVLWRIENGNLDQCCPKLVVLHIGSTNIIEGEKPGEVVDGIIEVVNMVRKKVPKAKILLMAILPLGRFEDAEVRSRVMMVNEELAKIVHDPAVSGVNIEKILLDDNRMLPESISHDGVHLSLKGYQLWAEAISPTIDRLLSQQQIKSTAQTKAKLKAAHSAPPRGPLKWEDTTAFSASNKNVSLPAGVDVAFCINLDHRSDRWEHSKEEFRKAGLFVERWPAVNSKHIVWDNLEITQRAKHYMVHRQTHEDLPSLGAIGCYLSHVSVWQHIVDSNISVALIFEDDVLFDHDFFQKVTEYGQIIQSHPPACECTVIDLLLLGAIDLRKHSKPTLVHKDLVRIDGTFFGTGAYLVTHSGAKLLLQHVFPIETQIDAYMGMQSNLEHRLGVFSVATSIVHIQSALSSNIQTDNDPTSEQKIQHSRVVETILGITTGVAVLLLIGQFILYLREKEKVKFLMIGVNRAL